jgi:SSS family solute:Na+ symporter
MAGILGQWRNYAQLLCWMIIPLTAYAILHLPKFADLAQPIQQEIATIHDPIIRNQMRVPICLAHILPTGLLGLFAAVILASGISSDNSYLHSWGTIFVQDVLLPLRRKEHLDSKQHLLWLRLSIVGVAVFGFCFSLLFPLKDYILMFQALTSAVYLGGAGSVIIGGLYWKRGTTAAAWCALIIGSTLAFGGILVQQIWPQWLAPRLLGWFPDSLWLSINATRFPVNGQIMYFFAMISAIAGYVVVSLLWPHKDFDMDRLLRRGKYMVLEDAVIPAKAESRRSIRQALGLTPEFTRIERWVFWATLWWSLGWWGVFLTGTAIQVIRGTTDADWAAFWWFKVWLSFFLGIATTAWMLAGGLRDAFQLFKDLRKIRVDVTDDGSVELPAQRHDAPDGASTHSQVPSRKIRLSSK